MQRSCLNHRCYFAIAFALAGIWGAFGIDGYRITSIQNVNVALNPLAKTVEKSAGAWLTNYQSYPWMLLAPTADFAGIALTLLSSNAKKEKTAFVFSSTTIAGRHPDGRILNVPIHHAIQYKSSK